MKFMLKKNQKEFDQEFKRNQAAALHTGELLPLKQMDLVRAASRQGFTKQSDQ